MEMLTAARTPFFIFQILLGGAGAYGFGGGILANQLSCKQFDGYKYYRVSYLANLRRKDGVYMLCTLLGYRVLDFVSQEGNQVKGYSLYVAYEPEDNSNMMFGMLCDKVYVSYDKVERKDLVVGKDISLVFNMKGKVIKVEAKN